jgi:hypothetical protein
MKLMTFELTFTDATEADEFFAVLSYKRLPVRGAAYLAAHGYNDHGQPIVTFARQHLGNRLTYTFTEQPRRG